jgi:hypothetical protein
MWFNTTPDNYYEKDWDPYENIKATFIAVA